MNLKTSSPVTFFRNDMTASSSAAALPDADADPDPEAEAEADPDPASTLAASELWLLSSSSTKRVFFCSLISSAAERDEMRVPTAGVTRLLPVEAGATPTANDDDDEADPHGDANGAYAEGAEDAPVRADDALVAPGPYMVAVLPMAPARLAASTPRRDGGAALVADKEDARAERSGPEGSRMAARPPLAPNPRPEEEEVRDAMLVRGERRLMRLKPRLQARYDETRRRCGGGLVSLAFAARSRGKRNVSAHARLWRENHCANCTKKEIGRWRRPSAAAASLSKLAVAVHPPPARAIRHNFLRSCADPHRTRFLLHSARE